MLLSRHPAGVAEANTYHAILELYKVGSGDCLDGIDVVDGRNERQ